MKLNPREILKRFNRKEFFYIYIILAVTLILSFLRIHGSSIGVYDLIFNGSYGESNELIYSTPKYIRSDEWLSTSPIALSQEYNNLEYNNKLIGLGQNVAVINDAPTNHWSTLFKPYNWGFFIMPFENAFAFKWWIRGAFLLISAYIFLMFLSKKKVVFSIIGSLTIYFLPFVQWWYSTSAVENIAYYFLLTTLAILILNFKSFKQLLIYTLISTYVFLCYTITFYPPFQISIGLGVMAFVIGYALNNRRLISRKRLIYLFASGGFILIVTGMIIFSYYTSFKDIFLLVTNTIYPGQRKIFGGGFPPQKYIFSHYNFLLQNEFIDFPRILNNQSEAAGFFLFPYLLIPIYIFRNIKSFITERKIDFILVSLVIYLTITMVWAFVGIPEPFSKLILVNFIPIERIQIGIGIVNLTLFFYFLTRIKIRINIDYTIISSMISIAFGVLILACGLFIADHYPIFALRKLMIILIGTSSGIILFTILIQKKLLAISLLLIFTFLTTFTVNPLYIGLDSVDNNKISVAIRDVPDAQKSRWVVYDNMILGNYLIANGLNSINSLHQYPQFELWSKFDPEKKLTTAYNRYGYIIFSSDFLNLKTPFISNIQDDVVQIKIDPCDSRLKELNIRYYVMMSKQQYQCLKNLITINTANYEISIFERIQ